MPEEKVRVDVFLIKYRCDECKIGYLRPLVQASRIDSWEHRCPQCGARKILRYLSPKVVIEEIDE